MIRFLLVSIARLAHRQLALHQALHKGIALCALQIEQYIYSGDPSVAYRLSLVGQSCDVFAGRDGTASQSYSFALAHRGLLTRSELLRNTAYQGAEMLRRY
jgi:hypothetical protein